MYHKVKIGQLSHTQISRLLNGHGVRVSHGSNHEIELSKEQLKKYMKAKEKGKAITLTMDPFQMENHQHLRGSGSGGSVGGAVGRRKKFNKWVDTLGARPVIEAGMSKATSTIAGSGNLKDLAFRASMPDARKASHKYGPNLAPQENKEYDGPINLGFGLKKRRPRIRSESPPKRTHHKKKAMKGSALMPAGY